MTHTFINPSDLHDPGPLGYSHTARLPSGRDLVFVAGQYGSSPDGGVASPLFAEQVRRALANLGIALAAHDLAFADVVSLRTYVVAIDFEKLGVFAEAMKATWGEQPPPNTLVGVASLATPDIAFEVEAIAARP